LIFYKKNDIIYIQNEKEEKNMLRFNEEGKVVLSRIQVINCWDIEEQMYQLGYTFPDGVDLCDLFDGVSNDSYVQPYFESIDWFEQRCENQEDMPEWDIKIYQALKTLREFLEKHTDAESPNDILIYMCW
jgi:hypothetical protein